MPSQYPKRKRAEGDDGGQARNHKQPKPFKKAHKPSKNPDDRNPHTRGFPRGAIRQEVDEEAQQSINSLKSRVRNLTRLLRHADNDERNRMPQGIRIEREREIESCKHELEEKQKAQQEAKFKSDMISRYHMVRFFERRKATRILKQLHKQLAELNDSPAKTEKLRIIHNADVDLNYTLYYPLLKVYVSLWPKPQEHRPGKPVPLQDGPKGDVDMWRTVEKAMEDRTLEALRESKEGIILPILPGAPESNQAKKKREDRKKQEEKEKKKKKERNGAEGTIGDVDEDSDEGFFA